MPDVERSSDYLIILSAATVLSAGDLDEFVRTQRLLVGPRSTSDAVARVHSVIHQHHTDRQTSLLVRANGHVYDACWDVRNVDLEEIVLGYLGQSRLPRMNASDQLAEARAS